MLVAPRKPRDHNMIVKRALKAERESQTPEEFAKAVERIREEDFSVMLDKLPKQRRSDPKTFYKIVKAVGGVTKSQVLV